MTQGLKYIVLAFLMVAVTITGSMADVINKGREGQRVDITRNLEYDKITIVDFFSDYCGPCHSMADLLDVLEATDDSVSIHRVDIDRPGASGIDWNSPVARQYGIESVPFLVILDDDGNVLFSGDEARAIIEDHMQSTFGGR